VSREEARPWELAKWSPTPAQFKAQFVPCDAQSSPPHASSSPRWPASIYRQAGGVCRRPQSNGAWDRGQYLGRFRTGGISPTRLQVPNPLRTPGRSLNSTTVKTFDRAHIRQRQQKYLRPGRPGASALPRNSRRAATRNLGTIVPFGRCAVHAAGINWSTGEFGWVRNSRVLVATLPRSPIPTKANKTALYAPGVVRFSQPAASSGGLLNAENSGPKFEPPGAKPQPSSKCRFSSP
jgi:hypothetical protein